MAKNIKDRFRDKDMEQIIGMQLRVGVITASIIVLAGGIFYLLRHGSQPVPDYKNFIGENADYTTLSSVKEGIAHVKGRAIIMLGAVILIATPVLRVLFSLLGFIIEKDRLYIAITLFVLAVMCISIFGGLKG
ncbi:MAG: DUF1634 domain-containing protein [Niabella sp.]